MPALCYNAAMEFQCATYTHNNEFVLNALLECILPVYAHCILSYLKCFIHLNFLLTVCLLFATGNGLAAVYILYNFTCTFSTPKQLLINAHMSYVACHYSVLQMLCA